MSIKAIPTLVLALIIYNAVVFFGAGEEPHTVFVSELFRLPMPNGGEWVFTIGDLLLMVGLILLCIELIKATFTRSGALADQALSMVLFVVFIVEFLLVPKASTSIFFLLTLMTAIDVVAGAIIGIRTARRDFGFGTDIT